MEKIVSNGAAPAAASASGEVVSQICSLVQSDVNIV